jgi:hypothetical protein
MYAAVHDLVTQSLVSALGEVILDQCIGSDLEALVTACPILCFGKKSFAYSALAAILGNVPALDVANRTRGIAAVRVRT